MNDADFDIDNMFPTPPMSTASDARKGTGPLGTNRDDAKVSDEDNRRVLRGKRPSRSKVQ